MPVEEETQAEVEVSEEQVEDELIPIEEEDVVVGSVEIVEPAAPEPVEPEQEKPKPVEPVAQEEPEIIETVIQEPEIVEEVVQEPVTQEPVQPEP